MEIVRKYFEMWKNNCLKVTDEKKVDNLIAYLEFYQKTSQIAHLKAQLRQKDSLISELKSKQITEAALWSLEKCRIDLRTIFPPRKCRPAIIPIQTSERKHKLTFLTIEKAPKLLLKMQENAVRRLKVRTVIAERKMIRDAERMQQLRDALELKRAQDEAEIRDNLNVLRENRRRQLRLAERRRVRRIRDELKRQKADTCYRSIALKRYFCKLKGNWLENRQKSIKSWNFYCRTLLAKALNSWFNFLELRNQRKYILADLYHNETLTKRYFRILKQARKNAQCAWQTAEDWYDFKLQSRAFVTYHRHVCETIVKREKAAKTISENHEKHILIVFFYRWCTLPAVNQLQRQKDKSKAKWRQKVWTILPDYRPPLD